MRRFRIARPSREDAAAQGAAREKPERVFANPDYRRMMQEHEDLLQERETLVQEHKAVQRAHEDALREKARQAEDLRRFEELLRVRGDALGERQQLIDERARLLERISALEAELERVRVHEAELERDDHTDRTSKLMLLAANYAESVRETARRDAELALRKAESRAEEIVRDQERERKRAERELLRLQGLTNETRTRLAEFTRVALQRLNGGVEVSRGDASEPTLDDLRDSPERGLTSTSVHDGARPGEAETRAVAVTSDSATRKT